MAHPQEGQSGRSRQAAMAALLLCAFILTFYSHAILGKGTVFTHLFYIPIILASLWWQRKGLVVAAALAAMLLASHFLIRQTTSITNDILRALMFLVIGFLFATLSESSGRAERALRESEKKYRQLVQQSSDGILLCSAKGDVMAANPKACDILARSPREMLEANIGVLVTEPDLPTAPLPLAHALAGNEMREERRLYRIDGTFRQVDLTLSKLGADKIQIVIRDVTERNRLERQLLEISDREQRRIGQDLHDGVCQQLSGISFMTEALLSRMREKALPECNQAERIAELLGQTIDQAHRLAKGLFPIQMETDDLLAELNTMAAGIEEMFGVECSTECSEPIRIKNIETRTHLHRIAQEAAANACRHGEAKHIQIRFVRRGSVLLMTIEDDGGGFSGTAPAHRGLGLSIMKYRAKMIGGSLDVQATPAGGTVVTCAFRPTIGPQQSQKQGL